eukprot:gene20521-40322_t
MATLPVMGYVVGGALSTGLVAKTQVRFGRKVSFQLGLLVALLSATGAQTETIPPSIVLITIGSVTGVSIAALFTGGLLPAVVLGAALCAVVWWRYRREDLSGVQRYSKREIGKLLLVALPAVLAYNVMGRVVGRLEAELEGFARDLRELALSKPAWPGLS